jgi:hypothetical protein
LDDVGQRATGFAVVDAHDIERVIRAELGVLDRGWLDALGEVELVVLDAADERFPLTLREREVKPGWVLAVPDEHPTVRFPRHLDAVRPGPRV